MKRFKFFREKETYDDLGFFEKIEFDEGWAAALNFLDYGVQRINSPYDHDTRSHEVWTMGWDEYMSLYCN